MSDELFRVTPKLYRRKRTHTGEGFADDQQDKLDGLEQAKRAGTGLYCKACRRRVPWAKLVCEYEKQGTDIIRIWFCECGNALREDNLDERPDPTSTDTLHL